MKTTNHLEILQAAIGKEFISSPSPFMHWLQPIVLAAESGKLSFQYTVRKEMTNPIGTLHGGVTAAIIDDVIGATMFSLNEDFFYTTLNNVIDYFSAGHEGDVIIAETMLIKKGKQIVNAQCEVWNADKSRLIARGYSNLLKTEMKR
jgi:acyl-coenzyme A thioesterase 13